MSVPNVADRLRRAGCVQAESEADELVAAAPDEDVLEAWVGRRAEGEPLAWITGLTRFCGRTIRVDPGVYVPRRQTETLARRAAALLPVGGRAVDLCTGSGAIAAHLIAEVPTATVVGVEISSRGAACARRNGVPTVLGSLGESLLSSSFDLVTAVAPYVPSGDLRLLPADVQRYEPRRALDGGEDGLAVVRGVVDAAARLLRSGGWLVMELGGAQDRALEADLTHAAFEPGSVWFDDEGDLRGLAARTSSPVQLGGQQTKGP